MTYSLFDGCYVLHELTILDITGYTLDNTMGGWPHQGKYIHVYSSQAPILIIDMFAYKCCRECEIYFRFFCIFK